MKVLSIESSCDETSLAILENTSDESDSFVQNLNNWRVLSSVVSSQVKTHAKYGGVVPEIGARMHASQIHFLFEFLLKNLSSPEPIVTVSPEDFTAFSFNTKDYQNIYSQIEMIFVTTEPGLTSALKVGMEFAKTLTFFIEKTQSKKVPIIPINHLNGHVYSSFYHRETHFNSVNNSIEMMQDSAVFPHLHLLVSGGNTQFLVLKNPYETEIIGQTLDDAAGECLDKIGRMLGFGYPGGVGIAKTAGIVEENFMNLPIGMKQSKEIAVSYSGLKTACRLRLEQMGFVLEKPLSMEELQFLYSGNVGDSKKLQMIQQFAISAQHVVVEQLIQKTKKAISQIHPVSLGLSGGVSANQLLRKRFREQGIEHVFIPQMFLTGDNAIMIGLAGIADKIARKHTVYSKD
jgi:N6-L-threonylcarbamoyladenine synthase